MNVIEEKKKEGKEEKKSGPKYFVDIEGTEYPWSEETITVSQIRELGNLPLDLPVIEIDPDNNEITLKEDEIIHLKPGHRYGKKVKFKRGLKERMAIETQLLLKYFPSAQYHEDKGWIIIPEFRFATDIWNRKVTIICFQVPSGYAGQAPYGFYVEAGLRFKNTNEHPKDYKEPVNEPPFEGNWGKFSWQHDNSWRPTADVVSGSNILNFVISFQERLKEGV